MIWQRRVRGEYGVFCLLAVLTSSHGVNAATRLQIVGGTPIVEEAWNAVVWLDGGCTGTVIDNHVVVYAAHCGVGHRAAWVGPEVPPQSIITLWEASTLPDAASGGAQTAFDAGPETGSTAEESESGGVGRWVPVRNCVAHPESGIGTGYDVAVCFTDTSLPSWFQLRDSAAAIVVSERLLLAGYGITMPGTMDAGLRRGVWAAVEELGVEILIGDTEHGTCRGDSGGPALRQESDGRMTLVGVLSSGEVGACGRGWYTDIARVADWLPPLSTEPSHARALPREASMCGVRPFRAHGWRWYGTIAVAVAVLVRRRKFAR